MKFWQTFFLFIIMLAAITSCGHLANINETLDKGGIHGQDAP